MDKITIQNSGLEREREYLRTDVRERRRYLRIEVRWVGKFDIGLGS